MIVVDLLQGILSIIKACYPRSTNRQKSYTHEWYSPIVFQVGEKVIIRVSPTRRVMRNLKEGKFIPRYVGP